MHSKTYQIALDKAKEELKEKKAKIREEKKLKRFSIDK